MLTDSTCVLICDLYYHVGCGCPFDIAPRASGKPIRHPMRELYSLVNSRER